MTEQREALAIAIKVHQGEEDARKQIQEALQTAGEYLAQIQAEKEDLAITAHDMPGDDENLREAALDNTDDDGTPLNEGSFKMNISASDLDIPGENLDDADENIGEEDEENNDYSLGADNDEIPEDDF